MIEQNVYTEPKDQVVIRTDDVYQSENEIGISGYSDTLLSVIANFTNSGIPEGFNACCMVGKSKRGDTAVRLYAVIDEKTERFVHCGFKVHGCLSLTACASIVCQMLEGRTFDEALAISIDDIKKALDGVPWDRIQTVYFIIEAIRALIGDFLIRRGASLEVLDQRVPCDRLGVKCIMVEHCSLRDSRVELLFGIEEG